MNNIYNNSEVSGAMWGSLETQAMHDAKINRPDMPGDLLDGFYYLAMYSLYGSFFQGQLSREQAKTVKSQINKLYQEQRKMRELDMKLRNYATMHHLRVSESARNYAKNKTIENADALWNAVHDLEVK